MVVVVVGLNEFHACPCGFYLGSIHCETCNNMVKLSARAINGANAIITGDRWHGPNHARKMERAELAFQLSQHSEEEAKRADYVGKVTLDELNKFMSEFGLKFGDKSASLRRAWGGFS